MTTPEERARKAEAQRRWRAKKGARTGQPGPAPTQPCGTRAAYARHLRHGEEPDDACKAANARYRAELRARKKSQ